ncbi:MAG: hypothetical protein IT378_19840 [Sandaracinaceae bacterium]|nr:hypothetical protein [Sandaracinaceae bacterium]
MSRASLLATALALTACGPSYQLTLPEQFVQLQEGRGTYQMRATTTDGVVVGLDVIPNREHASPTFWVDAARRAVRDGQGYALLGEDAIDAASGQHGQILRFGRDLNGHAYRYTIVLFVTPDAIWLIEAGGREAAYTAVESEIEASIRAMRF